MVLGRISNLPTVWSNCLVGCYLGGGNSIGPVLSLCLGGTLLYIGGMFLNDVYDVNFDAEFRRERPIVSGALNRGTAIGATVALFTFGVLLIASVNWESGVLAICLTILIVIYDWAHKRTRSGPLLMAGCRFFLYLTAAAAGLAGITGRAFFFAATMAIYVAGLSYLARGENRAATTSYQAWLLICAPILVALLLPHPEITALACLPFLLCVITAVLVSRKNIGRAVGILIAGIILVDLIAISTNSLLLVLCLGLFCATLLFQRYIPAT